MFQEMNKDIVDIYVCKSFTNGHQIHYAVCFGEHKWYNRVMSIKAQLIHLHKRKKAPIPNLIQHLDEHKFCVEYGHNNKQDFGHGINIPKPAGIPSSQFLLTNLTSSRLS